MKLPLAYQFVLWLLVEIRGNFRRRKSINLLLEIVHSKTSLNAQNKLLEDYATYDRGSTDELAALRISCCCGPHATRKQSGIGASRYRLLNRCNVEDRHAGTPARAQAVNSI
jgi:hypothetical protein